MLKRLFNWYFGRKALPYWGIVVFDLAMFTIGGLLMFVLLHPLSSLASDAGRLMRSFCVYAVFCVAGFRVFHTYSGVLRYSQFEDLVRVVQGILLAFVFSLGFNFVVRSAGWDETFYPMAGRMCVALYLGAAVMMCASRVVIRLMYDTSLVSSSARPALIYGTRRGGIALAGQVRNEKPVAYHICGFIGDDREHYDERLLGKRVYSVHEDLRPVIRHEGIKVVLVSPMKQDKFRQNKELQDMLLAEGVQIFVARNAEKWLAEKEDDNKPRIGMREVSVEDLLPRDEIEVDMESVGALLRGSRVLVSGSAGSIGLEIVRQVAAYGPAEMMLVDQAETPQHDVRLMMAEDFPQVKAHTVVTSICKADRMEEIFSTFRPDYVFHAAAYKHVPMMEDNPSESVQNNVYGTKVIADLSVKCGVRKFVMISTDKAVNPTNVMGCSKRICEIYVQSLDKAIKDGKVKGVTQFVTTRFGNVLGSNGSVIPLFRRQLEAGGPLTVTHPRIIRYFMLIPEACKLVLEAGTHGKGGEIFVFDMGEPVRIADLAKRMILLSGAKNVTIEYTGLREGEKLYEEVLSENENTRPSFHKKIRIAEVRKYEYADAEAAVEELQEVAARYDDMATVRKMKEIVPEYVSKHSRYEALDKERGAAAE